MELEAAKMIGAGLAAIALAGAGVGIGIIFGNYLSGAMRNPSAAQKQFPNLLLGFALAEATGLFGLVVALIILFGVIKKLLKLVLVVSALLVLWIAYSTWSGNDVSVRSLTDDLQSGVDAMKGKASEVTNQVKDSAIKKIDQKTEEQVNKILPDKK